MLLSDKIKDLLDEHFDSLRSGRGGIKDVKQWVFEMAMEYIYGKDIWKTYNKLL